MDLGGKAHDRGCQGNRTEGEMNQLTKGVPAPANKNDFQRLSKRDNPAPKTSQPAVNGTTKRKVRRQLQRVMAEGRLNDHPGLAGEWQLVKWHLSNELKLSPLRIVFLFSEVSTRAASTKP